MIELTKEQQTIHDDLIDWIDQYYSGHHDMDYISLGGLAGTGKTTLLSELTRTHHQLMRNRIAFVTFTGKASIVLRNKIEHLINETDFIGTIHSLLYVPIIDPKTKDVIGWSSKGALDYDLIIIDEASMVNNELWKDLISYEIPIIAVGDHGQLPPIGKTNFSLMSDPDFKLETIHRQAQDNPIIKLSQIARNEGYINQKIYGPGVACLDWSDPIARKSLLAFKSGQNSQILCGMNKTRVKLNQQIRSNLGFDRPEPFPNEKVICLKNNKNHFNIMNGQMGFLTDVKMVSDNSYEIKVKMDGIDREVISLAPRKIFNMINQGSIYDLLKDPKIKADKLKCKYPIDFFDFGYAISVHKSQGSEWNKILLIEEYNSYQSEDDCARWLYTAITRAKEKLLVIQNYY